MLLRQIISATFLKCGTSFILWLLTSHFSKTAPPNHRGGQNIPPPANPKHQTLCHIELISK